MGRGEIALAEFLLENDMSSKLKIHYGYERAGVWTVSGRALSVGKFKQMLTNGLV